MYPGRVPNNTSSLLLLAAVLGVSLYIARKVSQIMTAVQIQQEDLDATAASLETLVDVLNGVDLTPLPEADQSKLVSALADVTTAANRFQGVNVPTPNPEPGPTDTTPVEDTGDGEESAPTE